MKQIFPLNSHKKLIWIITAIVVSLLTTGLLRIYLIQGLPGPDGGYYTYLAQEINAAISNKENLAGNIPLALYSLTTSWVFNFEINQFFALRWIDLFVAIFASFLFFKVILKESGSLLFTVTTVSTSLFIMNDHNLILYGFRNSTWIAYVPLFAALILWQNSKKEDNLTFYLIGALTALGVLFREPFLVFFIVGGISIWIAYGWKNLLKYLIGTAILGFTITGIAVYLRGGDVIGLINSYTDIHLALADFDPEFKSQYFYDNALVMLKRFWFGVLLSIISIIYIFKLFFENKKTINIHHFCFWITLSLIPIVEAIFKLAIPYHFSNCIPGIVGISAIAWRYLSKNETKKTQRYILTSIIILFIYGIYPHVSNTINAPMYKKKNAIVNAYNGLWNQSFQDKEVIKYSPFLTAAYNIRQLTSNNSTLVVFTFSQLLYPLSGLRPPTYELHDLRMTYSKLNGDEDKIANLLKKHQPTIITPMMWNLPGIPELTGVKELPGIIERTGLYEKVMVLQAPNVIMGDIYRLKNFKQ